MDTPESSSDLSVRTLVLSLVVVTGIPWCPSGKIVSHRNVHPMKSAALKPISRMPGRSEVLILKSIPWALKRVSCCIFECFQIFLCLRRFELRYFRNFLLSEYCFVTIVVSERECRTKLDNLLVFTAFWIMIFSTLSRIRVLFRNDRGIGVNNSFSFVDGYRWMP